MNLEKCRFAQPKVIFLGHIVGSGIVAPDPSKIATVREIQPPTNKKEVKRIVEFFSYFRSFIPNLAQIAHPITELTKKGIPNKIRWEEKHQISLQKLIDDLSNAASLNTIDYRKKFGLSTDASATAVGCCLFQWSDDGTEAPIAFASLKLSPTQTRWSTIEREAYAVVWALNKFKSWILLSEVVLISDHNPLTYLTDTVSKSAKLTRWALALQEYQLTFQYRSGRKNVVADFLSRKE